MSFTFPQSISWTVTALPANNQTALSMPANVTVTANYVVNIQVKGDGDLKNGSNTIPLSNVYVGKSSPASNDGVKLSTTYQNLYTGLSSPDDAVYTTYWFVTVPSDKPNGEYTFTYYIKVE